MASEDDTRRQAAVDALKAVLAGVDGVVDIGDDDPGERRELRVEAKSSAVTLGLSESSIGQQVRTGLLGSVAHRFALDGEEVDLRVRLDNRTRRSTAAMEQSWIVSAAGVPVPLAEVASLREATAPRQFGASTVEELPVWWPTVALTSPGDRYAGDSPWP